MVFRTRGFAIVVIVFSSDPLARFFDDPRLRDVVLVLAVTPSLQGFYNLGQEPK